MKYVQVAQAAAQWASKKIGCKYSQTQRTKEGIFDCSSLVARAYSAQGKQWRHGGTVPTSMYEVYDDDFELIWPENYADIGKKFGGNSVIKAASRAGDLQFICTDPATRRSNKITHVAMVCDDETIVHARSTKYGVCKNAISLYSGKICAVVRYNPLGALRRGMCGWRTLALQKHLNKLGAALTEDGEYGSQTQAAVRRFQQLYNLEMTGVADKTTLALLRGDDLEFSEEGKNAGNVQITGNSVNIRQGPGTKYEVMKVSSKGDIFQEVNYSGWIPIEIHGEIGWVSENYAVKNATN